MRRRQRREVLPASDPQPCDLCGKPGWSTWDEASVARRVRISALQRLMRGPAPVLTIRTCDDDRLGLFHLGEPYIVEHNAQVRVAKCSACGLIAWRGPDERDQRSTACFRPDQHVPPNWWTDLLDPRCGLIRQSIRLRTALSPPTNTAREELLRASVHSSAQAALFVDGVGLCLQMIAAVSVSDYAQVRAISTNVQTGHDAVTRRDMWRYAALMQGLAAGRLPLREYWDVRELLNAVAVPSTARTLLARVQLNATFPLWWRLVGVVL